MNGNIEFYTVEEVKNILNLSQRTVYKLVHKPDFPKLQIGHKYMIPKKDFEKFVQRWMYKHYKI